MNQFKVIVIDDSVLYRKILSETLAQFDNLEVVATAHSGKMGLFRIAQLEPDLVTLDFEMPGMDGIQTIREIKNAHPDLPVIMVSSHTEVGAKATIQALDNGAFDFISKPAGNDIESNKKFLYDQLAPIIKSLVLKRQFRALSKQKPQVRTNKRVPQAKTDYSQTELHNIKSLVEKRRKPSFSFSNHVKIVAVGISTGGPNALVEVLPRIPAGFRVPIVVVQHMPPIFTKALAESLGKKSQIPICEAEDRQVLENGKAYIAPGGKQMKLVRESGAVRIRITDDPPENNCKPAADYLFRSVADIYRGDALGVIMTGMGCDGTKGLKVMKSQGARVIAQDEQSCVVFGMPMEAVKAGVVDSVLPLEQIAEAIVKAVK